MNEFEFESSLRRVRPSEPSPELERRIAAALEASAPATPAAGLLRPRRPAWPRWLNSICWATAGATAGVAAVIAISPPTHVPPKTAAEVTAPAPPLARAPSLATASVFEPAESAQEVVSSEDAGTVFDADNQPSRRVRYTSIEKHRWMNPATGAEVQLEMPREDVVLVPVSYQ